MCVICVARVCASACHTNVAYPPFRSHPLRSARTSFCRRAVLTKGLMRQYVSYQGSRKVIEITSRTGSQLAAVCNMKDGEGTPPEHVG